MPIASPIGFLDVVNATLRASQVETTSRLTVANTAATKNFSVGDRFHIDKDSVDPVSVTGNVVASGIKISNLTISPTFDLGAVSNVGNTTSNTLQFANATTGFTTTANVEIGGNITLTSNAQVKVGSNVLAEYTGPHGREPKEVPIKKFPEIAFEKGKFDSNPTTNTFVQAGYTITSSGNYSDDVNSKFTAWRAFTGLTDGYGPGWVTPFNSYTSGVANSTQSLTNIDTATSTGSVSTRNGAWVKLELPTKIKLGRVDFYDRYDIGNLERVSEAFVYGGNSNSGPWYELGKQSDATGVAHYTDDTPASLTINTTSYYKYYIIQPTQLEIPIAYGSYGQLMFYGTEEPAPPGDLSLDTTLKSTFNSVRSNNYVMYFDGEDPAVGNVPKYLPSGSAKSITPNNVVFDATNNCWTLDGSTESNVTTGSLGFEGDAPHTVSTWINASNLEANALTQQLFSIGSGYDKAFLKVDDTQIAANTWHNVTYAYQGEGGSKVTYVDGRKVEESQVEDTFGDYPPFAMTDYEVGGYRVSASNEGLSPDFLAWYAFDALGTNNNSWTPGSTYSSGTPATYPGSERLPGVDTSGATIPLGEWLKLQLPYKLVLSSLRFNSRSTTQSPKDFKIYGSNDDYNWDLLLTGVGTGANPNANLSDTVRGDEFAVNATKGYKYLAMSVQTVIGNAYMHIADLKYYGHKEGDLTRFPEPTRVLKYPHIAMTGPAQRGYVASASSVYSGGDASAREPYNAFGSQTIGSEGDIRWRSADNSGSLGSFTGSWLKLELPHKIVLSQIKYRAYHSSFSPESYVILASNNDSTWVKLHDATGQTNGTFTISSFSEGTPSTPYKYYAFLTRIITNSGTAVIINDLHFFGTQEDTGTPTIVGGPFAGKVANFRVYDQYLGDERIQEIYDAQKDAFGHKKSSMTFYKGRIGVGTTEPEGALTVVDEPHTLERFPATDLASNDTYVDGQGIIKVRSSYRGEDNRSLGGPDHAYRTDVHAYRAFKGDRNWISIPERNTRMSEEVDFGAWLKIQTPQSMSLKKAEIESNPYWAKVGSETYGGSIDNTTSGVHFGRAVACSHDGTRVIVGGYVYNNNQGLVKVYDWNGSSWTQVGSTLTGTAANDLFGRSVAISGDGNIIAVAAPREHAGSGLDDAGIVRVYYLNGSTWTILPDSGSLTTTIGSDKAFVGETAEDRLGQGGVKLSYDGYTVAMGEAKDDTGVANIGRIRVFTYSNGAWSQKGSTLLGNHTEEEFGQGLDMSEDGNHLIIGTKLQGGTSQPPRVEVYRWTGSAWAQKGSSITYADTADGFGPSVSISTDGNTIGVGIKNADAADGASADNAGVVYVYHWSGSAWGTPHKLIQPVTDDDDFGDHQVMSGDGKRIIVGASHADDGGTNSGRLYTFEYTGGSWVRREVPSVGADGGTNAYLGMGPSNSAHSHAISRDGSVIVAGESGFYTNGQAYSGRVRIYNMPSNIKSIWGSNDDVNWTKITTAPTREEATSNVAGLAFGYDDRLEFKNLDNPNYYKYHAIVADAFTTLKNIRLYGIREKASSTIHDGALTLTKNLVVPRIGPAFDADDTPRRDRLVVEYTTSTNPTDYGYVKDTSGNGYDAKMVGVVYNPSDKSFECSASDGSQWIETYIPNGSRFNTQFSVSVWANMGQFDLTSLYGFIFALGDRNQTGLSSTSGNELSLVYNHAGLTEGTFFTTIEGQNLFFKEFTTHDSHMGQWYHLVMTYDGSTLYVYKNGENSGYATRTAPVLPDDNCVVRLFGDAVNENATHQGVQSRISNFKLYDCCLTRDEARTLYDMGRCDEGHHVVSFEKTRVGIGLGDGCAPKAELDVRGTARIGPSGQQWRTSGDEGDRLIQFHSGQATSGQPTLEVTQYGGTRASPTPTVLQISNELGGGADWSTTEPYGMLSFANADGTGSGVAGPAASVGAVCDTVNGGGDTRLAFFTNSGTNHLERMSVNHDGNVDIPKSNGGSLRIGNPPQAYHSIVTMSDYIYRAGDIVTLNSVAHDVNSKQYLANYGNQYINMFPCMSGSTFYLYGRHGNNNYRDTLGGSQYFTGQHVGHPEDYDLKSNVADYVGLTVCSAGTGYRSYNGSTGDIIVGNDAIAINESLPNIKLSSKSCDSSVIGVVTNRIDKNTLNTDGTFEEDDKPTGFQNSLYDRVRFNSVGEGALWVTDINGPIQNGDYVTTSNVVGYCMKQSDDILHNYTVAKVTMPCDFNPILQPVRVSKKVTKYKDTWVTEKWEEITEDEYNTPKVGESQMERSETVEDGITIYKKQTVYQEWDKDPNDGKSLYINKEYEEIAKDELGRTILENDPDGKMELPYKIRYLDASGNEVDEATHVIKAAFLGCTYHCG